MLVFFAPTVGADTASIAVVGNTPIKHVVILHKGFAFIDSDLIPPLLAICSSLPRIQFDHLIMKNEASA
jgi:hypothetical protein